jgi:hypothetical protein
MYKNNFTNEIGNNIIVKVKNIKNVGVNHKTGIKYKFDCVNIQLIGPTSMSENIITYKEAKEIYRGLGTFFRDNKMKTLKQIKK